MGKLTDIYNSIKNPLEDKEVLKRLVKAYASYPNTIGPFYNNLVMNTRKEHTQGYYNKVDADYFYSMMFNKWKNNVLQVTDERFEQLYRQGSLARDFLKLREYLKGVPNVTTWEEADKIFRQRFNDQELQGAMNKYRWNAYGEKEHISEWQHVCSKYVTAQQDTIQDIIHRLYINTESIDTHKMISLFVDKCSEHQLSYYFKFSEQGARDDTIVIYSNMNNLPEYINILKEIEQQHPELVSRVKEPPVLTGKIDGWIGYGSEPPNSGQQSFNGLRGKPVENALKKATKR